MIQNYRKKDIRDLGQFGQSFLNDKQKKNNYLFENNQNNVILNKNKRNNNKFRILQQSNGMSLNNSFFNNSYLNVKYNKNKNNSIRNISKNNSESRKNKNSRINNNKNSNFGNFNLNSNIFKDKKINISSYLNKNSKLINNNKSFIYNKTSKSPLAIRENNIKIIYRNNNIYNNHSRTRNYNLNFNAFINMSMRNNNNIFQPVNIFSKYKRNKSVNNNTKNNQYLKKYLEHDIKDKKISKSNNNKINKNLNNKSNTNIIENKSSSNIINKTNDTTLISSGNLANMKINNNNSNNNNIFGKNNNYVREIDFHVDAISINKLFKKNKKKIFKGKKIKCMHDLSKTGMAGDEKKVNQDNYFIFKNFVQGFDFIFMGVCDGHGYYGQEVSGYIKENLPMDLNHMIKAQKLNVLKDDLSPILKNAFILENKSLLRNKQMETELSGSTCVSVIFTPEKLILAHIGDSRCILGKCTEIVENEEKKKKWTALNLTRDHKPTIPEEADRILKKGGRIRPMKDEDGEFIGPLRVYMKEKDMPGLAMTRSFGDYFGSTAGIISEPEVNEYYFKEEDKFLVLASDGLFEFMENEEIVKIIQEYFEKNDIVGCCEYLYKESTRKWLREEEDVIDDITIILVFLDNVYKEVDI